MFSILLCHKFNGEEICYIDFKFAQFTDVLSQTLGHRFYIQACGFVSEGSRIAETLVPMVLQWMFGAVLLFAPRIGWAGQP